ncbi:hypothetical protein HU200_019019 [Digitaria exilis]|uniref:Uncharacterized protein n=1 Tax=Digitaria exilis TaxID=1010633 RepID=A0A835F3L9_9POAL|nr:hypothetical protein HU200_019019 [Digitaria exilis]
MPRLPRRHPPPPYANQFAPDAPAASTAQRGSSTARLWLRPRRLRSAAVSPASTAGRQPPGAPSRAEHGGSPQSPNPNLQIPQTLT